jgi:hypothetical protein
MSTDKKPKSAQQLVTDRFNRARDYRVTSQDEIWKRSYNNWRGILDSSLYPWRSKLFIPWSFIVVETIIPRVFARDPKWRAISRSPDFPYDGPRVVSDLLGYQWNRMGMRLKMYDYIKDSLMYSKGYAKVTWNYQRKTKTFMEPVVGKNDEITFEKKTRNDLEYDDPMVEIVDPADIYVDPDATSSGYEGDGLYLIHRKTVPLETLKENPNYKNVDKIKQASYADQYMDKLLRYRDEVPPKDKHKDLVEILEYWEQDRLIVVANRSVVLRDTPNPYSHKQIPFVELDDYRDPHKLYGQSELSVIDPLQREVNSIRNQRRDYDNLALNPVVRMVPGTLRNPNSAVMAPGAVWMVSDLQSMDTFTLPQLQGSAKDIEQQTAQDIKMATAIDEIGIGLLPDNPQRRSATEVVTSQQSAGRRFAMKIALLEEAVKKIGELVFALNQQFLDRERMIQIVGERGATEWVQLSPEDIRGEYFIDIETGSMLPKDEIAQRKEAVELLQYITPIITPVVGTNPEIIMPVLRMVLDTFDLAGKQDIFDELQRVLGQATQTAQERQQAETAASQAQAMSSVSAAAQPPQMPPDVTAPQTGSEAEAQAMLDAAAAAGG